MSVMIFARLCSNNSVLENGKRKPGRNLADDAPPPTPLTPYHQHHHRTFDWDPASLCRALRAYSESIERVHVCISSRGI